MTWPMQHVRIASRSHSPSLTHRRSQRCRATTSRAATTTRNAHETHIERPSRQNLCHALVDRSKTSRLCLSRWKAYHLGCVHNEQSPCHSSAIVVGNDLRIFTKWKLRRMWRSRQYLLHLQPQRTRRSNQSCKRIEWTFRIPQLLSIYQRQTDSHIFWRHDLRLMGY